ncbi:MAG: hypothetical protein ABGW69_00095 [Nanoarchaeota archaeon]
MTNEIVTPDKTDFYALVELFKEDINNPETKEKIKEIINKQNNYFVGLIKKIDGNEDNLPVIYDKKGEKVILYKENPYQSDFVRLNFSPLYINSFYNDNLNYFNAVSVGIDKNHCTLKLSSNTAIVLSLTTNQLLYQEEIEEFLPSFILDERLLFKNKLKLEAKLKKKNIFEDGLELETKQKYFSLVKLNESYIGNNNLRKLTIYEFKKLDKTGKGNEKGCFLLIEAPNSFLHSYLFMPYDSELVDIEVEPILVNTAYAGKRKTSNKIKLYPTLGITTKIKRGSRESYRNFVLNYPVNNFTPLDNIDNPFYK